MSALLDTSVVIGLARYADEVPEGNAISAVTVAEMAIGAQLDRTGARAAYLRKVTSVYNPLPFDAAVANVYGQLVSTIRRSGRLERSRKLDLMITATAVHHALPLYTLNGADLKGLEDLVQVVDLGP